jgi:hypothetical protein
MEANGQQGQSDLLSVSFMPLPNCLIENPFASGKRDRGRLEPHVSKLRILT